jgi:plasminogen activator inhibitor 1 RNA-binding protein
MSKNFFAALDDSGDEAEITTKVAPKETKKPAPAKPASAPVEPAKNDRRRGHKDDRNTKQGRGRPPARDGKRTYDRRSGTGRGKEIKKGGGGSRNWGNDKNDARKAEGTVIEGEEEAVLEPKTTEEVEAAAPEENKEAAEEPAPEVKEEEEDKTMTLDDYLKNKSRPESDAFKPVAEKEFVDEFAGKAAKKSVEEDFLVMGGGKSLRKKGAKKDGKVSVDVGFRVSSGDDMRRGERRGGDRRGGRGGRGSGRGGGSRGGRGGGKQGGAINVADADAFPSL